MSDCLSWDDIDLDKVQFIVSGGQMKSILKIVGNNVDENSFIVNKKGERVMSQSEDEIKLRQLGSLSSGSKNFIKKNIASYSEFLIEKRKC